MNEPNRNSVSHNNYKLNVEAFIQRFMSLISGKKETSAINECKRLAKEMDTRKIGLPEPLDFGLLKNILAFIWLDLCTWQHLGSTYISY